MLGNSIAGASEVPFYGLPSINLGSRQNGRSIAELVFHCDEKRSEILDMIEIILNMGSVGN